MLADKEGMKESLPTRIHRTLQLLLLAALLAAIGALAGSLAWQWGKAAVMRDAYRARLSDLEARHNALVADYNQAVARTAVCEVRQAGGKLSVVVRTCDGRTEEFPLAFDPTREIHFDFVCLDGRLLMRRVYDDQTAPQNGVLIQSSLAQVDWSGHGDDHGLVLYRPVPEGRYALKVSGNGALTLEQLDAAEINRLEHAPLLRRYEQVAPMHEADRQPSAGEIWRGLTQ